MTPINEMTNEQLDRWVAEKRGWVHKHCEVCGGWHWWLGEDTFVNNMPFTTDPRYAFELLEEMAVGDESGRNEVTIWKNPNNNKWYCEISCIMNPFMADTSCRAIAVCWAEWRGGE